MKLFGSNVDLVSMGIAFIIGIIISYYTLCSCSFATTGKKEAFTGASMKWGTDNNINRPRPVMPCQANADLYGSLTNNVAGEVPLPKNELFFFYKNQFKPECCNEPQQYSSSAGCACISADQMKYLSSRGGNNTAAF